MQGILAAAQHGHILAAVEKGIAGGAKAYAVALQPGKAWDARHRAGSPCGKDDSVRRVICTHRFYGKFIGIGQAHGFGRDHVHAQTLCVFNAAALQLGTGDGLGKTVVVFNFFGAVEGTGAFGQHGGVHPGTHGIQCRRHPRRAGTDDHNVGHTFILVLAF